MVHSTKFVARVSSVRKNISFDLFTQYSVLCSSCYALSALDNVSTILKHEVSETGSVYVVSSGRGKFPTELNPLTRVSLGRWTFT
jgi:hypothetical protein